MKGRFAPSPTGHLHLGNIWVALLSWLHCKQQGGTYVLRMEDIDTQRSKRHLGEAQMDDLEWLGLYWDEGPRVGGPNGPYLQSERSHLYESVLTTWRETGQIYPCFCNRARLYSISSAPHGSEGVIHYDGHCRQLTATEQADLSVKKHPSWRLKVENRTYTFQDLWQGKQIAVIRPPYDDFVVKRADSMYAYNLAVVYDDIHMGITEIIRGYDLLPAVGAQLWLYELFKATAPVYGHVPLVVDEQGYRLSKRQQSITIKELREAGYSSAMILGHLALAAGLVQENQLQSFHRLSLASLKDIYFENLYLKEKEIKLTNFDIEI